MKDDDDEVTDEVRGCRIAGRLADVCAGNRRHSPRRSNGDGHRHVTATATARPAERAVRGVHRPDADPAHPVQTMPTTASARTVGHPLSKAAGRVVNPLGAGHGFHASTTPTKFGGRDRWLSVNSQKMRGI